MPSSNFGVSAGSNNLELLKHQILECLSEGECNAFQLIAMTKAPRSSVYTSLNQLVDEGKVRPTNPHRKRGNFYTLGNYDGPNSIIPALRYGGENYKAPLFLQTEDSLILEPFHDLILGLALIMKCAEGLTKGVTLEQTEITLRRAKRLILDARQNLDQMTQFASQIIDEERFWNPIFLEKFIKDDAWRSYHDDVIARLSQTGED